MEEKKIDILVSILLETQDLGFKEIFLYSQLNSYFMQSCVLEFIEMVTWIALKLLKMNGW